MKYFTIIQCERAKIYGYSAYIGGFASIDARIAISYNI